MKKLFILILPFIFLSSVSASSVSDFHLTYGNDTFAYNWSTGTTWQSLPLHKSNGYDGGTFYTDTVATGNYGISFGTFLNTMLLKGHYYRLVYAVSNSTNSCSSPNSWANQLRFGTGMGNSSIVDYSFRLIGIQKNVNLSFDDPSATYSIDVCTYTMIIGLSGNATFMNLPVNSNGSLNSYWTYYGYSIEDIGLMSELSKSDLDNMANSISNSINNSINNSSQNIINNQNQNQQQTNDRLDGINDSLTDSSVNNNTGSSFFNGFQDNDHGLSSIILAPINILRNIFTSTTGSCTNLSFTYHNKNVSLPCGKIFWNRAGIDVFYNFYNLVVGGFLCYCIIRSLFIDIEELKDPAKDKVDVMNL